MLPADVHQIEGSWSGASRVVIECLVTRLVRTTNRARRANADSADQARPPTTRDGHTNAGGVLILERNLVKIRTETAAPGRLGLRFE